MLTELSENVNKFKAGRSGDFDCKFNQILIDTGAALPLLGDLATCRQSRDLVCNFNVNI